MTASLAVAGLVQILGGVVLAPLLPGTIQQVKARLQGRRGPSVLQPYRDLRRLWGKSAVRPEGSTAVYLAAPAVAAACLLAALPLLPVGGISPDWPVGHDALALVGLLALARFAVAAAAWDTGSGFALMGASRDLTLSVFVEPLLLLVLVVLAVPAGGTDLRALGAAGAGATAWATPAHWCALVAFTLVVLAETGRQPVDNPDTHLELTMIHEGPLLEYAGRDLAYLQWVAAARHWVMLLLAAELFLPHFGPFAVRVAMLAVEGGLMCLALALVETSQAKMRILMVPRLLGAGMLVSLVGLGATMLGGRG